MEKILSKMFGFLKYILLIIAFGLVFFGIMKTYGRLDKPLTDAVSVFLPFGLVLVMYLINLGVNNKYVSNNLFFNFVSVMVFTVIIIVCLRSMFDVNMILYHKYNLNFNPSYFADNLSLIQAVLYMIAGSNLILLVCGFIDKNYNKKDSTKGNNDDVDKKDKYKKHIKDNDKIEKE